MFCDWPWLEIVWVQIVHIIFTTYTNIITHQTSLTITPTAAGKNKSSLPIRHRRLKATKAGISKMASSFQKKLFNSRTINQVISTLSQIFSWHFRWNTKIEIFLLHLNRKWKKKAPKTDQQDSWIIFNAILVFNKSAILKDAERLETKLRSTHAQH